MHADIGIGILISIFVTWLFGVDLTAWHIAAGIFFALLPDIDLIPGLSKLFGGHRGLTHQPLVYVPIILTAFLIGGLVWTLMLALGVATHLIHDTFWIGHGIAWLWPHSDKRYKFYAQDYKMIPGMGWIKFFYGRATIVSVSEAAVFIFSLSILYLYTL
ncbi:MAG: metal-dependent hydrolase [Patescibacteria group bacterium]